MCKMLIRFRFSERYYFRRLSVISGTVKLRSGSIEISKSAQLSALEIIMFVVITTDAGIYLNT